MIKKYLIQINKTELNIYNKLFSKRCDKHDILVALYCDETNCCIWRLVCNEELETLKEKNIVLGFNDDENFIISLVREGDEFCPLFPNKKNIR